MTKSNILEINHIYSYLVELQNNGFITKYNLLFARLFFSLFTIFYGTQMDQINGIVHEYWYLILRECPHSPLRCLNIVMEQIIVFAAE